MYQDLYSFQELYNSKEILMYKKFLNKIIQKFQFFVFHQIDYPGDEKEKQLIKERGNESKIIILDQLRNPYSEYLIIIFDQTIIIIPKSDQEFLINLLNHHNESTIFTASDRVNSILPTEIQSKIYKYEEPFKTEYLNTIDKFSENFSMTKPKDLTIKKLWKLILPILSSYFINKSYIKLQEERQTIYDIKRTEIYLNENNYITLQNLGQSVTSNVQLIFHCETEQLFVLKSFFDLTEEKLFSRELKNYKKNIRHPNLPIFYGEAKIDEINCLIIEYIRGNSLFKIDKFKITEIDKINIIFQLMLTIEFLQSKQLIYRDLKPSNLILDSQKNLILIDFDRMIEIDEQKNIENRTKNFSNPYMAPELLNENFDGYSYEEDVYSIGLLIYYIMTQQQPFKLNNDNYSFKNLSSTHDCLIRMCEECSENDHKQRPKITKLIDYFYNNLILQNSKINITSNINETKFYPFWKCNDHCFLSQFLNGYKKEINEKYSQETNNIHLLYQFKYESEYYPEEYFSENISTFISCLSSISDQNQALSQFYLGKIYFENKYVPQDINKCIHYLTLSSNQNNTDAEYYLGLIYYNGKYVQRDINKALYYLTISSNQNNSVAQFYLGLIYFDGKYISRDTDKSIHYLTLSSNQNNPYSQYLLGKIYYEGKYIQRDINKSIHYLTLSSNQNHLEALYYFGYIYYEGKHIKRDINKALHYFTISSNKNHSYAQYYLGFIYYEGKYVSQDIKTSIHYFTLSANQNFTNAQFYLGKIYFEGIYIQKDIKKAIHYLQLAANKNDSFAQLYLGFIYYDGIYVSQDIDKSIYYLTCVANKNDSLAQFYLGKIYYEGKYVPRDIHKSIHYFTLSANQNFTNAQLYLGNIYYEGEFISRDINKSIHYLTLSSNNSYSQILLAQIYYEGKYITRDISKFFHYITLSANQKHPIALTSLAIIYENGKYVSRNIEKAIHYYILAANQNYPIAQYYLGLIYYYGKYVNQDAIKGIDYLMQSSENRYKYAHFHVGFCFHEGKYTKQDIFKAIRYYKDASNVDDMNAKNNLGIIYKNGFSDKILPDIQRSIEYFRESIQLNKMSISLYNLSHIYIYNFENKESLDEAIELLISFISTNVLFSPSYYLLAIALIKKYEFKIENIKKFFEKRTKKLNRIQVYINNIITKKNII